MEFNLNNINREERKITLDIIIPIYNEEEVIPKLASRLSQVFSKASLKGNRILKVNYIFIDDGSSDNSISSIFGCLSQNSNQFKIIQLSRNFGHQAAVTAGIAASESDVVAIIDADLQDPPEVILKMIKKWRLGFDVVYGQRTKRKEGFLKVFLYWLFYRVLNLLTPVKIPLDSGDFCLIGHNVVNVLNSLPETIRFPRGLRSWVGFSQTGVIYERPKRAAGKTKYNFGGLYNLATNGITSLSLRPLKLAQVFAFSYLFFSMICGLLILLDIVFFKRFDLIVLLFSAGFLFSNSIILFCIYILGAYIGRTYVETKARPNHIVKRVIDSSKDF